MNRSLPPVRLEVAAALLVPSATYGYVRLFVDSSALPSLIGASLLSTGLAVAGRRLRLPLVVSALVSLVGLGLLIARRFAGETLRRGVLPTGTTVDVLNTFFDDGLAQFRVLKAPVEVLDPFLAAAMIGCWVLAFLTDWGALRLRLAFEPVLPAGLLFVFCSVLGSGEWEVTSTVVFVAGVLVWAVVQRSVHLQTTAVWLRSDQQRGPAAIVRGSALLASAGLLVGLVGGQYLPGAQSDEWYSFRNPGEPVRQVVSPFISIAAQLTEQRSTELFTVRSDRPAYWRLAGLDEYRDGEWVTRGRFEEQTGDLPGRRPNAGTTLTVRQEFTVTALDAIWLPAAFAPAQIVDSSTDVSWNPETGSLTVDGKQDTSDGVTYALDSIIPLYTPDELRGAVGPIAPEIAERFLPLPSNLSPVVEATALEVTAGAGTDYDKMLALQSFFRQFDYSVSLSERTGDPVEQFLDERIGFCQQFSGTFALMARTLGVPSRVAVGFTWGDPVAGEPGLYSVSGRQAHAWPEVWFPRLGWVAFEPTPGRGSPDATHNPVNAAQDSSIQPDRPGEPTTTTTFSPAGGLPTGPDLSFDPGLGLPDESLAGPSGVAASEGSGRPPVVLILLSLVLLYSAGAIGFHRFRHARRRQAARTPAERIDRAWAEANEALELASGQVRPEATTRQEWATRLARGMQADADDIALLADAATLARFQGPLDEALAEAAEAAGERITRSAHQRMGWRRRVMCDLDPRRLQRPTRRRVARP